jgi:hypothetical protein
MYSHPIGIVTPIYVSNMPPTIGVANLILAVNVQKFGFTQFSVTTQV